MCPSDLLRSNRCCSRSLGSMYFSYTFGVNNSRLYVAYNEHRADTTDRILLTKLSYRFNF